MSYRNAWVVLLFTCTLCLHVRQAPGALFINVAGTIESAGILGLRPDYFDTPLHWSGERLDELVTFEDGGRAIFRVGGSVIHNLGFVANEFDLDSKLSIAGLPQDLTGGVGHLVSRIRSSSQIHLTEADWHPLYGFYAFLAAVDFDVRGVLAAGDEITIRVSGQYYDNPLNPVVTDAHGNVVGAAAEWIINTPGPFERSLHYDSARFPGATFMDAGISFTITRGVGVTEESWVSFTDPGISMRVAAVPEPSAGIGWIGACIVVAFGRFWPTFAEWRNLRRKSFK
ncbi:MAG: hypothetical protein WD894_00460 [Pirellulales bacterium]